MSHTEEDMSAPKPFKWQHVLYFGIAVFMLVLIGALVSKRNTATSFQEFARAEAVMNAASMP